MNLSSSERYIPPLRRLSFEDPRSLIEANRHLKIARVLSLDGGGIRGIIPATIIKKIEEGTGKRIKEHFHMMAGTSTGAIIACGAEKFTGEEMCNIYKTEGPTIFQSKFWKTRTRYKSSPRIKVFEKYFGTMTLRDLSYDCLIPFYDITTRHSRFFKSHRSKILDMENYPIYDVLSCTTAAPTFFKPYEFMYKGNHPNIQYFSDANIPVIETEHKKIKAIDGGVFANDPSLFALTEMFEVYPNADTYCILSIGTGSHVSPMNPINIIDWARCFPEISMYTDCTTTRHVIKELSRHFRKSVHYLRLQLDLPKELIEMDEVKNVLPLEKIVNENEVIARKIEQVIGYLQLPLTPKEDIINRSSYIENIRFVEF